MTERMVDVMDQTGKSRHTYPIALTAHLNPASFVDFEQGIARTHNCAGERPRRSHVIS
jgi:hypothetical protein